MCRMTKPLWYNPGSIVPPAKGMVDMAMAPDRLPTVVPADWVPGPKQGQWTYQSYAHLPDDGNRYEIVNGVLFMSPSPNVPHQRIAFRFARYLATYIEDAGMGIVLMAPSDVELSAKNVLQPDVFVVLNAGLKKVKESHVVGAPDLVIEIASPSTAIHDRNRKYHLYAQAGVSEYWIAEPASKTVEVLVLESGEYRSLGIFRGKASLPSQIVPDIKAVPVERFFVQA